MKKTKSQIRAAKPILYPAEFAPTSAAATSKDLRDADYLGQLSKSDRDWYYKFQREYYLAVFPEKPLHKTKTLRKTVYADQESRKRSIPQRYLRYQKYKE